MRIPAYLRVSRHGIYFFRICIPVPLQRRWQSGRELKVSLRTRDQRVALTKARDLAIAAHKHFGYALVDMTVKPFDPNDMSTWPTEASDIRKFEKTIETVHTAEGFVERVKYKVDPNSPGDAAAARTDEILYLNRQRMLRQPNSPEAQAYFLAEEEELRRSLLADAELADARRKAELAELEARTHARSHAEVVRSDAAAAQIPGTPVAAANLVPGPHNKAHSDRGELDGHSRDETAPALVADSPEERAARERRDAAAKALADKYKISSLWDRFLLLKMKELGVKPDDLKKLQVDEKLANKIKTVNTYQMKFGVFLEWSGDRHIEDLSHEDITEYKEHLMHKVKVRAGRKAGQIGLDITTVDNYVGVLNGLYKWAQKGGLYPRHMLVPTYEQRETTKSMKRARARSGVANRAFKPHELIKAFAPASYLAQNVSAHHYWPALIALFTGMRLGEVSQLALDDIRLEQGIWAIDINDDDYKRVKSAAARRVIPMHPVLMDLGLPAFVAEVRKLALGAQLFPMLLPKLGDGSLGNAPGKKWDLYLKAAELTDDALTFHSLRKTANTLLKKNRVPFDVRCQMVGHENDHVNELYSTDFTVTELAEMVFPVFNYEGLDLSGLKRPEGYFDQSIVKDYERAVDDRKRRLEEKQSAHRDSVEDGQVAT
jgi:integrase